MFCKIDLNLKYSDNTYYDIFRSVLVKYNFIDRDVIMFEVVATEEKKVFRASNSSWGYYELPEAAVVK